MAESDACLLVETPGEPSILYFPAADIDRLALDGDGARDAVSMPTEPPALVGHGAFDTEREARAGRGARRRSRATTDATSR